MTGRIANEWASGTANGLTGGTACGLTGGTACGLTGGTACGLTGGTACGLTGGLGRGSTGGLFGGSPGEPTGGSPGEPTGGSPGEPTGASVGGFSGGLAAELRRCLAEWSRRTGIAVETWALPAGDVPPRAACAVPAALREALTLAGRETAAVSLVSVAVTSGDRGLRMTVSDNGAGLPVDESGPEVTAMRAAFAAAGGTISVRAVPGEGTTVTGVLPLR